METNTTTEFQQRHTDFFSDILNNLYLNHFELHDKYPEHSPSEWRDFLSEYNSEILKEISYLTEASARKSLARLNSSDPTQKLTSADITAIKALLEKSEQLNRMTQAQQTFISTFLPDPDHKFRLLTEQEDPMEMFYVLTTVMTERFYQQFDPKQAPNEREDVRRNGNGTLRFINPDSITDLDRKYLAIFNPNNQKKEKGEWDIQ